MLNLAMDIPANYNNSSEIVQKGALSGSSAAGVEVGSSSSKTLTQPVIFSQSGSASSSETASQASISTGSTNSAVTVSSSNPAIAGTGLLAQYYEGLDLTNLRQTRIDPSVNFNWGGGAPDPTLPSDLFSVRWSGQIQPQYSETYTFFTNSDDGVRLWVNGELLINDWTSHAPTENVGSIALAAGQLYDIRLEYYELGGGALSQLLWASPSQNKEIIPQSYLFPSAAALNAAAVVTEQARSAYSFVDSIGFNTHLRYYDTAYGNYPLIKQLLLNLGVRHIRDGGSDPTWIQRTNELAALGIKSTVVIDPNIGTGPNASYDLKPPAYDISTLVKIALPGSVEAVEVLNEFDVFRNLGYSRGGQAVTDANWVSYLRDITRDTYVAINSDPATQDIAVIGPSFVYPDSSTLVGDLSQWVDYGNAHPYSYPNHPGNGNLQQDLANRAKPFGNHPIIATEVGFPTGSPLSDRPVSEAVQGKYIPRMFLENFNAGVPRTFSYELIDQLPNPNDSEMNFGIVRYDGTPKPAYTTLQYLIGLLNDTPTPFTPGALTYSLSGNTQNIHHTLLQKSNGNFYMVLWLESPSTDATISQTVNLTLNTPIAQATTYLPNLSVAPTGQYQAPTQLTLNVPDSPLIVQLSPN